MAQTKPKAGQFYGVSNNGTDGEFLQTDGVGGMAWASPITNPTITSIDYPGTATAANPAGGESVIINGTLFASGITCTVGGTTVTTVLNSATQITINTPAKSAGAYTVAVTNSDGGTASQANFIQYSGIPIWTTAAGNIGSVTEGAAASFQVTATEGTDTIEYAVTTGTLPTGLSLATATGAITGTAPAVSADTTTTFSITATDDENQTSAVRSFNVIVTNDAPSNYFAPYIYTGNSGTQNITLNFKPDLVWIKERAGTDKHILTDSIRGTNSQLSSNETAGQTTYSSNVTSFNSNGFTLGSATDSNGNNDTFVSWNFKAGGAAVANTDGTITSQVSANNTLGFSIASYTSTGTNGSTFGHGLDAIPELVLLKCTSTSSTNWIVGGSTVGSSYYLSLNSSAGQASSSNWLVPSATTLQLNQTFGNANSSGREYITYNFTSKTGFSKVGTYTGNGSLTSIVTGFEPAFLMIKRNSGSGSWIMLDNKRDTSNPRTKFLTANTSDAEGDAASINVDFLANGFTVDGNNADINNGTYIYISFAADGSTATPTLANSFNTTLYSGSSSTPLNVNGVGFKADFSWLKVRNNSWSHGLFSSVMPSGVNGGVKNLYSNTTGAASDLWGTLTWNNNGWTLNGGSYNGSSAHDFGAGGYNFVSWNWKGGGTPSINTTGAITSLVSANQAAGFSVVKWTTSTSLATVGHGLGAPAELIIGKGINWSSSWPVYVLPVGNDKKMSLNDDPAASTSTIWGNTTPTATTFNQDFTGTANRTSIAYCWRSITGYSKVGTYTGTGGALTVTTGFEPGFVMIKRTDASGSWVMVDEKRASGDNRLYANLSNAEDAGQGESFISTGFKPRQSATNDTNTSGGTYIYLAIKEN